MIIGQRERKLREAEDLLVGRGLVDPALLLGPRIDASDESRGWHLVLGAVWTRDHHPREIDGGKAGVETLPHPPDFLDVEQFPAISFVSTGVENVSDDGTTFTVVGDLSIHGVTRPVRLATTFEGQGADPWGNTRAAFLATATIDRRDFGLVWNAALESGGVLVSNEIKLTLDVQAIGS